MRIKLEGPYGNLYRRGYLRQARSGRRLLDLVNNQSDRTTVAYARYLMTVHVDRLLTEDEEVDHINIDHSDDRVENLQILTRAGHRAKTGEERRRWENPVCFYCGSTFHRRNNQRAELKGYKQSFCNRECYYNSLRKPKPL